MRRMRTRRTKTYLAGMPLPNLPKSRRCAIRGPGCPGLFCCRLSNAAADVFCFRGGPNRAALTAFDWHSHSDTMLQPLPLPHRLHSLLVAVVKVSELALNSC